MVTEPKTDHALAGELCDAMAMLSEFQSRDLDLLPYQERKLEQVKEMVRSVRRELDDRNYRRTL